MMYIFPKQFGLHNVFTSKVDFKTSAQKFQDYTLREEEIAALTRRHAAKENQSTARPHKLPKRLRGAARDLTERLQVLHARCSYIELLRHYCPSALDDSRQVNNAASQHVRLSRGKQHHPSTAASRQSQPLVRAQKAHKKSFPTEHLTSLLPKAGSIVELATPLSQVSAFCQAVLCKIIPSSFWGEGETRRHNTAVFLRKVDHFIRLRRFETMSLHEISQELKVSSMHGSVKLIPTLIAG